MAKSVLHLCARSLGELMYWTWLQFLHFGEKSSPPESLWGHMAEICLSAYFTCWRREHRISHALWKVMWFLQRLSVCWKTEKGEGRKLNGSDQPDCLCCSAWLRWYEDSDTQQGDTELRAGGQVGGQRRHSERSLKAGRMKQQETHEA